MKVRDEVESKKRLSVTQLRELSEVESLQKQQDEARDFSIYIPTSKQESADFESRQQRISHVLTILSEHNYRR